MRLAAQLACPPNPRAYDIYLPLNFTNSLFVVAPNGECQEYKMVPKRKFKDEKIIKVLLEDKVLDREDVNPAFFHPVFELQQVGGIKP